MSLPLPFLIPDNAIQSNFDALADQFPLSRKSLAVATPTSIGAAGAPAFLHGWANFGSPWQELRYWKDGLGVVHVEGLVASGTLGAIGTGDVFVLPAGFRPGSRLLLGTESNTAHGVIHVYPSGEVVARTGSNVSFSLFFTFKQEA